MEIKPDESNRNAFLWLLGGIALGATSMYLLDPSEGSRRRADLRLKTTRVLHDLRNQFASTPMGDEVPPNVRPDLIH